jgi:hypothetical protein
MRRAHHIRPLLAAIALVSIAALPACNLIDAALGRHAKIEKMVPGGNLHTGELECWLTLSFNSLPAGIDTKDFEVRFDSVAMHEPQTFDWRYIASHDLVANGTKFGSGHRKAEHTKPHQPPVLGEPIKVRFPLRARTEVNSVPGSLSLTAELYWGGKKQHSYRKSIEHVYSRTN